MLAQDLTQEDAEARIKQALWTNAVVGDWYLYPYQHVPFALLKNHRFPFLEQARRTGKTNEVLVHVVEQLRRNDNHVARWCEPWKYQAREIVIPELEQIMRDCPRRYRFSFKKQDSVYVCQATGSQIYLRGVNEDKGESARGSFAHIIVADEFGSYRHAPYIINEVLLPQLLSTDGQLVFMGTPPKDLIHPFYDYKEKAIERGAYCLVDIWKSEGQLYTKKQIEDMCEAVGGVDSPSWQREFLCNPTADKTLLVVPEMVDMADEVVMEVDRPECFDWYVGGDSGFDDNTHILFGFYDFNRDWVVIEHELVFCNERSSVIIDDCKEIEKDHYPEDRPPHLRVLDSDKQKLYDIATDHSYAVNLPDKRKKTASLNSLRRRVAEGSLKVHPRCKRFIRQLKYGMWKDEKHQDFERRTDDDEMGHLDGIAAGMYFNRAVDTTKNPYPALAKGVTRESHFINERVVKDKEVSEIASVFKKKF